MDWGHMEIDCHLKEPLSLETFVEVQEISPA